MNVPVTWRRIFVKEIEQELLEFLAIDYVYPWQEDWSDPGEPSGAEAMNRLMSRQVANARRVCPPGSAFGGSMVIADMTRAEIAIRTRCLGAAESCDAAA